MPAYIHHLFPYVGIIQIRLWVKAIQLTLSLLDTQAPRFIILFYRSDALSRQAFPHLYVPSAFCALLCLRLQVAQVDVKHLHPLHSRYQHHRQDRSAAA